MALLKICGVKTLAAARVAADNGADFIGIILVPNRQRTIDLATAREISQYLKTRPSPQPQLVGVFRNQELSEIQHLKATIPLDVVQLHGSEPLSWIEAIPGPVIKRVVPTASNFVRQVQELNQFGAKQVYALVDSEQGGDGKVFDWSPLEKVAEAGGEYLLAGGLSPENVKHALNQPNCLGVDVSGGVETEGAKDHEKIKRFLINARGGG